MRTTNETLRHMVTTPTAGFKDRLPRISTVDGRYARQFIRRHTAAAESNFQAWLGATVISARSIEARYVASENMTEEMRDNHASMLRQFAISAHSEPHTDDYRCIYPYVHAIRNLVAELSGIQNLTLMAGLENFYAAAVMPHLADLAALLGSKDLTYTDVHTEADIEHADKFLWALDNERKHFDNADEAIARTISFMMDQLDGIYLLRSQ